MNLHKFDEAIQQTERLRGALRELQKMSELCSHIRDECGCSSTEYQEHTPLDDILNRLTPTLARIEMELKLSTAYVICVGGDIVFCEDDPRAEGGEPGLHTEG